MPETYISRSLTPYLKQFRRDPPLTCKTPAAPSRNGTSLIRFASRSRRAPQRPRMIKLGMLGTVSLSDADGREVRSVLRQPRRLALLAYLAAATPRGLHRRDSLVALFWPELDQEHARAALRQALHVVRDALGAVAVASRGDEEIGLDFAHVSCDVVAFRRAVDGGQVREALELYRGDFLEGFVAAVRAGVGAEPAPPLLEMELLPRLRAGLADRYRVERELAHSRMATVFRARDLKHDRWVAIKVLHPELAAAVGTNRFLRE